MEKNLCVAQFFLRVRGDVPGGNEVKVRKYEGKMPEAARGARRSAREDKFSGAASFALAGVILILALCDLGILFTSY